MTLQEKRVYLNLWLVQSDQSICTSTSFLARTDFMGIIADDMSAFRVGASCTLLELCHAPRYNRLDQSKARGGTHTHRQTDRQHTLGQDRLQREQNSSLMLMGARGRLTFAPMEKKTLSDMTARRT